MTAFADQGPVAAMLGDGRRLHLQHGPIDLIIEAYGEGVEVATAYEQAVSSFKHVLSDLVGELDLLRQSARLDHPPLGAVAKLMWRATNSKSIEEFVTPMAAVAGAVAVDHSVVLICVTPWSFLSKKPCAVRFRKSVQPALRIWAARWQPCARNTAAPWISAKPVVLPKNCWVNPNSTL